MEPEEAHRMVEEAAERLAESLKAGKSDTLKAYLQAMGRFHNYSLGNMILIQLQRPDASRVAGYGTWKALHRQVRRGAKGISILAPVVARTPRVAKREQESEAAELKTEETIVSFRGATVFAIEDTTGPPLPEIPRATGDPGVYLDRLRQFIASQGIILTYSENLGGAEGMSCGGKILVKKDLPPAEMLSVLLHEVSHEILHRGGDASESKTVRETEAEATAHVVCEAMAIGIESRQASSDYVLLYDGSVETLRQSLHRIRKAAHMILDALLRERTVSTEAIEVADVAQAA